MIDIRKLVQSDLFRKTEFGENSVNVNICRVREHPIHFHNVLEIVFVIDGSITVKSSCSNFTLVAGEYMIINAHEYHSIMKLSENPCIAYMHFRETSGEEEPLLLYDIDVLKKDSDMYYGLRKSIAGLVKAAVEGGEQRINEQGEEVLRLLYSNLKYASFLISGEKNQYKNSNVQIERINSIANYMYIHYDEPLSLSSVAENFGISRYYLSHIIKGAYGVSFKEWLNLVRVDRSEGPLLETDEPISEICFKMGFASQQYFTRYFKYYFECTPSQYRKRFREETIKYRPFDEEMLEPGEELTGFFGREMTQGVGSGITVDLGGRRCRVHIIMEREGSLESKTLTAGDEKDTSVNIRFDCDEMSIVIKPSE